MINISSGAAHRPLEGWSAYCSAKAGLAMLTNAIALECAGAGVRVFGLAPGVIDLHTHYDAQLTWDKTASPSPALGVTSVVIGNCGFGIAPTPANRRDTVLANLSEVEAMSLDALQAGVDWGFETFGEYLELLRRKSVYPNVAVLASHTVMRTAVMGDEASERPSCSLPNGPGRA